MKERCSLAFTTLLALAAACGDDGTVVTATMESTGGSTGSDTTTTTSPTTTSPTTTSPTTTTDTTGTPDTTTTGTTGTTTGETTEATTGTSTTTTGETTGSTGVETTGSTSEGSTGSTSEGSTGSTSEGSTGNVDLCANGQMDGDESDIDCGGPACNDCGVGQMCLVNEDCDTAVCMGNVCVMPECAKDEDCAGVADACNSGVCDLQTLTCAKMPANEGMACEDADLCTSGELCAAGVCGGGLPKDCVAFDSFCGIGQCDPQDGQCKAGPNPMQDGKDCDDSNACTDATVCADGLCGDPKDPGYVLYEDFSDNTAGWTLDMSWEIKPAVASPNGFNGTDPAMDHTATMDNGVAGQFVGALVTSSNTTQGQFNCLTSPKVDTSGLPTVFFTYWRHGHLDYTNYVVNRIEVWNGMSWVTLQMGYPNPGINDANWTSFNFDVTAHKNPEMQVRICHQRNSGALSHGGWSVDDVTIGPKVCTP
jgi:hypothetical protein